MNTAQKDPKMVVKIKAATEINYTFAMDSSTSLHWLAGAGKMVCGLILCNSRCNLKDYTTDICFPFVSFLQVNMVPIITFSSIILYTEKKLES
jgi:hypothetical protein